MFDINGWEFVIILVVALIVIGPERLPEYAAQLRRWVRQIRTLAEGAKEQLREQMGPDFDNVDWKAYDPRQYDPRKIVREALLEEPGDAAPSSENAPSSDAAATRTRPRPVVFDPQQGTPYDADAT